MRLPILITGGSQETRERKAEQEAAKVSSKFDIVRIDAERQSGIETVRSLKAKLALRPFDSAYQTFIITEANFFTLEAQNALLKALEEPPKSSFFILTAPSDESVLSTIASRCQEVVLPTTLKAEKRLESVRVFLKKNLYQKYKEAEYVDPDLWEVFWREVLLSSFGFSDQPIKGVPPTKVARYLKLLLRLKSLRRKKLAEKLLKAILIIEAPRPLPKLAEET